MPEKTPHRYFIKTWGCQMNTQDERKMAAILDAEGYQPASSPSGADLILLNTCSVREKSADKLFAFLGRLGRLKGSSPDLLIGVTGCVAQQEGKEIFARAPQVDFVLGPRRIGRLPVLVSEARQGRRKADTDLDDLRAIFWDGSRAARPDARAYITIMEGCNMGCTFCIVPRTRGREVHRPAPEILDAARRLADQGVKEIELLGQTVNAYRDGSTRFHHLLQQLASQRPGLRRLRFTSSHPAYLTPSLAAV
ncbi:MAG: radical SAM protein, partial [Acidobacteriota bacterium]